MEVGSPQSVLRTSSKIGWTEDYCEDLILNEDENQIKQILAGAAYAP